MGRNEKQTRAELIDPALYARGWTEELIRRERTPGGVDIVDGKPRKRKGKLGFFFWRLITSFITIFQDRG